MGSGWGVLVLPGSSGRDESARAAALERTGVVATAHRWFGQPGQVPGICEVPLESFGPALDALAAQVDHVAVLGTSKGAEAALLLGVHDARVDAVVAISPPAHVWASVGPGADGRELPRRSSFTLDGAPLPHVGYDESWAPGDEDPPALRGMYEQSLAVSAAADAARIPVERITGPVVVTGGGDDQVWPSDVWARQIGARRDASGLATRVVVEADAGHQVLLPGEPPRPTGALRAGGTPDADARVGARLVDAMVDLLAL
ncbi:acyl-CoA thioester hydrolase/BAAT C-terminal domain-containing protein [Solicola sp. PLA-1-18]|uniref:acyl-CoA thioester hydrolase/BAAT C-terminal domain-containing protein n=1 Tax=Solicola sp. PLA-1-18 TaxID=3380532 RepID=UPI003B7F854B